MREFRLHNPDEPDICRERRASGTECPPYNRNNEKKRRASGTECPPYNRNNEKKRRASGTECPPYKKNMEIRIPRRKHLKRIPIWLPDDRRIIYFITACCSNRRFVFANAKNVSIVLNALNDCSTQNHWHIHYVCFMPDHVHMLLSPRLERQQPLSVFMNRWKSSATKRLHGIGVEGNIWQPEFFDRLLRSDESLADKWKYIKMNPVRKGLCKDPDDYPFCGTPDEIHLKLSEAAL